MLCEDTKKKFCQAQNIKETHKRIISITLICTNFLKEKLLECKNYTDFRKAFHDISNTSSKNLEIYDYYAIA